MALTPFVAGTGLLNCDLLYIGMPKVPDEGTEVYSSGFEMQLGGGTPAEMINLSRLNVPVSLATFIGEDFFSDFARQKLDAYGVNYRNLYTGSGQPVTVTSVVITRNERTFISYVDMPEIDIKIKEQIYELHKDASIIKISPALADVYEKIKLYNPDVQLVLDMGWSEDLSLETLDKALKLADYFMPNSKEAMKITGTESPEAAAEVLSRYFENSIVKLGPEGCLLYRDGVKYYIPELPGIKSVDATGAGDAFLTGFLYGLYHNCDIIDCICYGNAMGGRCVEKIGCIVNSLSEEQLIKDAELIKALYEETSVIKKSE